MAASCEGMMAGVLRMLNKIEEEREPLHTLSEILYILLVLIQIILQLYIVRGWALSQQ